MKLNELIEQAKKELQEYKWKDGFIDPNRIEDFLEKKMREAAAWKCEKPRHSRLLDAIADPEDVIEWCTEDCPTHGPG